eukprot:CAMPEP_0181195754 /NCGR_PEP_ID=MMETSP1096-20121128/15066_1 /TAXON_ID=156174 ORGANISM="Chrysochromulina ericina, Strain CCMP281" /NCGR_SAMPLE_ID=MMETSP1096 /ASSEMBLY_ACC=CAM_ASM_000453 /LENGTH=75 /DNA_ID=CAMNT_0023285399 /DNA_START=137 /DNA_END=362 /DNA_ORIENTATION=-
MPDEVTPSCMGTAWGRCLRCSDSYHVRNPTLAMHTLNNKATSERRMADGTADGERVDASIMNDEDAEEDEAEQDV